MDTTGVTEVDVVVVGGGAAGLSAALVLARARRAVTLVDAGEPRNARATHMHGYLSRDGMNPRQFLAQGRIEVESHGGRLVYGTAQRIVADGTGFVVSISDGQSLRARRVVVATGLMDQLPAIPGVRERWGRDVLHCPYCHGWEVRDQPLGVLGAGANSVHQALLIRQWSADVTFFPHGMAELDEGEREKLDARGVRIVPGPVDGLVVAEDKLRGIRMAGGQVIELEAVFVAPEFVSNDQLLAELGCAFAENGWVVTDGSGQTSVPGVWVAGNAADPFAQVISAAGAGSRAAAAINGELVAADVELAVAQQRSRRVTCGQTARAAATAKGTESAASLDLKLS